MNHQRPSSRLLVALAVAAGWILVSVSGASASTNPTQATDAGSSENSAGRHIVQNAFGYWAFMNVGYPGVVYSKDGITWGNGVTAGVESHIFATSDEPSML